MKKQTRNLVLALVAAVGFGAMVPPAAMAQAVKSIRGADVADQLAGLICPRFIAATPSRWYPRLPVYLQAVLRRLDAGPSARADEALDTIGALEDAYAERCQACPPGPLPEAVDEIGWLIEELRVGLFAQALGTAVPVSAKRVRAALASTGSATVR